MTRPVDIPRHGDVWAHPDDPGATRFTVTAVCCRHDPPHVIGYWQVRNAPPHEWPSVYPLPRFVKRFTLIDRRNFDEARWDFYPFDDWNSVQL